jgi:arylsulfatase A-like enzyme
MNQKQVRFSGLRPLPSRVLSRVASVRQMVGAFLRAYLRPAASDRRTPERIIHVLLIAACLGLVSGILEAGANGLLAVIPDAFGWRSDLLPGILWIAPLVSVSLFCIAALPIALIAWKSHNNVGEFVSFSVLGLMAVFGPLAALGRLSTLARVLLTLGVSVQMVRMAARKKYFSTAALGRTLLVLTGVVLVTSLVAISSGTRAGYADSQRAIHEGRPLNVLLIVIDTLRADHVSAYGYARKTTPNLDRIASEGVLFENAYSPASWTLPSHASIFTGRTPGEHGAGGRPLGDQYPTLAGYLAEKGYQTAGFSANLYFVNARSGLTRGFDCFATYFNNIANITARTYYGKQLLRLLPSFGYYDIPGRKRARVVDQEVMEWIDHRATSRPFFAFINYFSPHDPYLPPDPYDDLYTDHPTDGSRVNSELYPRDFVGGKKLTREQIQNEIDGYDGSISYVDAEIESLIRRLSARGLLDHTALVIASDHGEAFGEHGLFGHGQNVYRHLVHVPLILRLPASIPAGRRVQAPVSLLDLPATILDILDLANQGIFPGRSLVPCWSGDEAARGESPALVESLPGIVPEPGLPLGRRGGMISFLNADTQIIYNEEGTLELYKFRQDPEERVNLAGTPQGQAALERISAQTAGLISDSVWRQFGIPPRLHASPSPGCTRP